MHPSQLKHETALPADLQEDERLSINPSAGVAGNRLHSAALDGQAERDKRKSIDYWYFCSDESPLRR